MQQINQGLRGRVEEGYRLDLRKIDSLVAEKVMGWRLKKTSVSDYWVGEHDGKNGDWALVHMWKPSTDMRDAMEIVNALDKEFYLVRRNDTGKWVASFGFLGDECIECGEEVFGVENQAILETAELAICLAALKAVGVEVDVDEKVNNPRY